MVGTCKAQQGGRVAEAEKREWGTDVQLCRQGPPCMESYGLW